MDTPAATPAATPPGTRGAAPAAAMRLLRAALQRVLGAIELVAGIFPLTTAGIMVVSLGVAARFGVGVARADHVLHAAGTAALLVSAVLAGLVVVVGFIVRLVAGRRAGAPDLSVETGTAVPTGLVLPDSRAWPLVDVLVEWDAPSCVDVDLRPDERGLAELVTFRERGRHEVVRRYIVVRDVLGLASIALPLTRRGSVRVSPARGALATPLACRDVAGEGFSHPAGAPVGDLIEVRPYVHGDPVRLVVWKAFARTRRLLVRMPERAIGPERSTAAAFVAGEGDDHSAETARAAVERGLLGSRFSLVADGAVSPARDAADAVEQVIDSVRFRARGGECLSHVADGLDYPPSECVVFVPAMPGPWVRRFREWAATVPFTVTAVLTLDAGEAWRRRGRLARLLRTPSDAPAHVRSALAVHDELASAGAVVRVVEFPSGRVIAAGEVHALRGPEPGPVARWVLRWM